MSVSLENGSSWTWIADRDPGTNEANISLCNIWINTSTDDVFICVDNTSENQIWKKFTFV